MPLESGTTISALNSSYPLGSDNVNEGDNHLQLIKSVLKAQFPGAGGEGFAKQITATEDEINYLDGLTGNVQQQIDDIITGTSGALEAPAGTVMIFGTNPPPPGWARQTSINDAMLRLVSGTPGGTGGTMSPISMSIQHSHTTGAHTLVTAELPAHGHAMFSNVDASTDLSSNLYFPAARFDVGTDEANSYRIKGVTAPAPTLGKTSIIGSDAAHGHGPTGTHIASLTPRYYNIIRAVRQ